MVWQDVRQACLVEPQNIEYRNVLSQVKEKIKIRDEVRSFCVLQRVAACCSVLQRVAVRVSDRPFVMGSDLSPFLSIFGVGVHCSTHCKAHCKTFCNTPCNIFSSWGQLSLSIFDIEVYIAAHSAKHTAKHFVIHPATYFQYEVRSFCSCFSKRTTCAESYIWIDFEEARIVVCTTVRVLARCIRTDAAVRPRLLFKVFGRRLVFWRIWQVICMPYLLLAK